MEKLIVKQLQSGRSDGQNFWPESPEEKIFLNFFEMELQPYRDKDGTWIYPELPDTVRPATIQDLFMPSGRPNYGKQFMYYSKILKKYVVWKILQSTTVAELELMLNDKVIYVAK
jgi:hypothetical protein